MAYVTTIALVATAIAGVAAAGGALVQGFQQAGVARFNAKVAGQNAVIAQQQASADEDTIRRRQEKLRGSQIAAFGASGVTLEGSPLDIIGQDELEMEREALMARYGGTIGARRFGIDETEQRYRASNAEMGGYIGAGTALLTTAGRVYDRLPSKSPGEIPRSSVNAPTRA